MKNTRCESMAFISRRSRNNICFLLLVFPFLLISSCGYSIIGSKNLPFNSITIRQVQNNTYEPRLEDRLHYALSKEFLAHGVKVMSAGGDVSLDTTIATFMLSTIAAVDERVKEQELLLRVDMRLTDNGSITEFTSVESPIRITFETTGSVSEYVVQKQRAIDKAFTEISREIVSRIIIRYVE
ncbi:MAG: LPS assembly lipoprotein LptE [Thermodesulfovibrionia bacterium]|nr:LPS assembly lipoprotein LptE [Thermodesulfovibrionia bacterium]